jgi:hypothetical protein
VCGGGVIRPRLGFPIYLFQQKVYDAGVPFLNFYGKFAKIEVDIRGGQKV